jgi:hypothetical protein
MAIWHGYVLVERREAAPPFTEPQRQAIRAAMRGLAIPWDGVQPSERFQVRVSLDGRQAIYEIKADRATLTPQAAMTAVAAALEMSAATLSGRIDYAIFADGESHAASATAARAFLAANREFWEEEQP